MPRGQSQKTFFLAVGAICAGVFAASRGDTGPTKVAARVPSTGGLLPNAVTAKSPQGGAPLLVGDHALAGQLQIGKMKNAGGHYEAPLADGRRAVLTIDPKIQQAAERALARARAPRAAIVVMHVDGRVLALAGLSNEGPQPSSDPTLATQVWAPAASVFKIVTAASLLQHGLRPGKKECYHGGLRSVDADHLVDQKYDKTCDTLGVALARSQNALIAKFFHKHLGRDKLAATADAFGMSRAPRFAVDAEPNRISLPEDSLELARVAAGFWSTEISAVGGAVLMNVLGSGGMRVQPRIVEELRGDGAVVPVVAPEPVRVIPEKVATQVTEMLVDTVRNGTATKGFNDPRGRPFFPETQIAGKTGSLTQATPTYLAYSWFVGVAPADKPEVVISVLLGNPEKWYLKAHTAARLVLQAALK